MAIVMSDGAVHENDFQMTLQGLEESEQPQQASMKIGDHDVPTMVPKATPGVPDTLSHGSAGGVLGREPQFSDGPIFNRGVSEYRRALESPRGETGSLERQGSNTFNREVRRSPADGTFRSTQEFHDWLGGNEQFTTPRERYTPPPYEPFYPTRMSTDEAHAELRSRGIEPTSLSDTAYRQALSSNNIILDNPLIPTGWTSVEGGASPARGSGRNTTVTGRVFDEVPFTTKSGKEGVVAYSFDPMKKNIHVNWMGSASMLQEIKPHELGVDKTSEVLKELVLRHPAAETISAYRVSGVRQKINGEPGKVVRPIPWDLIYPNGRPDLQAAE